MADVLEQNDIDALLSAVGGTEDSVSVDNIVGGGSSLGTAKKKEVAVYDFKRPERVSKDQMRALEGMHEAFARNFGAALSSYLRTIVEVKIADTEQLTYSEFIHSLPNPTCINVFGVTPWEGSICLEMSPLIIYPILDRLLGGANVDAFIPQRPLTSIELRLVERIIDRAMTLFKDAWSSLGVSDFDLTQSESNPHLVQIVAPNEVVVVVTFEIKLVDKSGTMGLCIPFTTIEHVMEKLATQSWLSYRKREGGPDQAQQLINNLKNAPVNLRAFLTETNISLGQLMTMQEGDIIQTEKLSNSELIVQIEGRNKFAGRLGQFRGNRSVRVTRLAESDERL